MESQFIIPNYHVILVHYPLGIFVAGVMIELFAFLWRRSSFRAAGRWMILVGTLSMLPAALSGVYALHDVASRGAPGMDWADTLAQSPVAQDANAWHALVIHTWLQAIATAVAVFACVSWIACSDRLRRSLHVPILMLLLATMGGAGSGAWFAGEAIYRHGVGVGPQTQMSPGQMSPEDGGQDNEGEATRGNDLNAKISRYVDPIQTHMTLAGVAFALALVSVGLSIRRMTHPGVVVETTSELTAAFSAVDPTRTESQRLDPDRLVVDPTSERGPAARFWMLAALAVLLTSAAGIWFLASDFGSWKPADLWDFIRDTSGEKGRRLVHVCLGGSLLLLPLILALLTRFAPMQKFIFAIFTLLLVSVVSAQTWEGILLLYDTPTGSVFQFKHREVTPTTNATTLPTTRR